MRVSIELSEAEVAWIDRAVANGLFASRDAAIQSAIHGAVGDGLNEGAIEEAYRRGYSDHPEDGSAGEAGLRFLANAVRPEQPST